MIKIEDGFQFIESVYVGHLSTKLVANERFEEDHHNSDEVGRVDYVELL